MYRFYTFLFSIQSYKVQNQCTAQAQCGTSCSNNNDCYTAPRGCNSCGKTLLYQMNKTPKLLCSKLMQPYLFPHFIAYCYTAQNQCSNQAQCGSSSSCSNNNDCSTAPNGCTSCGKPTYSKNEIILIDLFENLMIFILLCIRVRCYQVQNRCQVSPTCGTSCSSDNDCSSATPCNYCVNRVCAKDLECGSPCSNDFQCSSGPNQCTRCIAYHCSQPQCGSSCSISDDCSFALDGCNACYNNSCSSGNQAKCSTSCQTDTQCSGASHHCISCNGGFCVQNRVSQSCISDANGLSNAAIGSSSQITLCSNSQITLSSTITINHNGMDLILSCSGSCSIIGNNNFPLMVITANTVTITGITFQNGKSNDNISANRSSCCINSHSNNPFLNQSCAILVSLFHGRVEQLL
jgi:hypothetical protein